MDVIIARRSLPKANSSSSPLPPSHFSSSPGHIKLCASIPEAGTAYARARLDPSTDRISTVHASYICNLTTCLLHARRHPSGAKLRRKLTGPETDNGGVAIARDLFVTWLHATAVLVCVASSGLACAGRLDPRGTLKAELNHGVRPRLQISSKVRFDELH